MADNPQSFWTKLGMEGLNRGPFYLIIGLLFYAPFCFGLRNGAGENGFITLSFVAFFLFCWQRFLVDQWPRVPAWMLFCFGVIAWQGFWMGLNANSYYIWHDLVHTVRLMDAPPFPNLPGSQHRLETPLQFYPQLGVFCLMIVVVNLTPARKRQLLAVAAGATVLFTLTGLIMKFDLWWAEGTMIRWYWDLDTPMSYRTVFASYRYHGNAATFLAIGLCLNLGFLFASFSAQASTRMRILAGLGSAILLGGLIINTSRAGWILGAIVATMFGARMLRHAWVERGSAGMLGRSLVMMTVVVLAFGTFFFAALHSDDGFRLEKIAKISSSASNRLQTVLFEKMLEDTPLLGYGPGAFAAVFPKYQILNPGHLSMEWFLNEAHQDYVQFLLDWGIAAFVCWLMIFLRPLGGWANENERHDPLRLGCQMAVLCVLLHALGDFPLQITSLVFYFGLCLAILTWNQPVGGTPPNNNPSSVRDQ